MFREYQLKSKSGRVVQPYMQTFPDEEAWRAAMDEQAKVRRKPKAA
jgi:hypothetical protein